MRAEAYQVHGRAFTISATGVAPGHGADPLDAIDHLMRWLDGQTPSQIAVLHSVLAATQDEADGFRFVELDEVEAAEIAALRFAMRGLTEPHAHTGVKLRAS